MAVKQSEFRFDLTGRHLALNLANTISRRHDPARRKEHLASYLDLLSFARQSEIVSPKLAEQLRTYAVGHPAEARRSFVKAITLREALYRVFAAIAQKRSADAGDLRTINDYALAAMRHRTLAPMNGGFRWDWQSDGKTNLERILWPIAPAAADLLTSDELKIVRFCEAPDCEWLFLDHSRNRSRRWCDMTSCGNRAKARRHYQRTHE